MSEEGFFKRNAGSIAVITVLLATIAALVIYFVVVKKAPEGATRVTGKITKLLRVCTPEEEGTDKYGLRGTVIGPTVNCGAEVEYPVGTTTKTNRVQLDISQYKEGDAVEVVYLDASPDTFYIDHAKVA